MERYHLLGVSGEEDFRTVFATHPAAPGISIVYVSEGEPKAKVSVLAWGVLSDASLVPITLNGAWDGTEQDNRFILFPDGHCEIDQETFADVAAAVARVIQFDR